MIEMMRVKKVAVSALFAAGIVLMAPVCALGQPPGGPNAPVDASAAGKKPQTENGTVIESSNGASFDNASHQAVFVGHVVVVNPQFRLTADKLTAFLRETRPETPKGGDSGVGDRGGGGAAAPNAVSSQLPGSGALERAVAEGHVVVTQIKRDANGKITEYIGKGQKGTYNATAGEFQLTGWPEVKQGINTHVATEASTVMTMSRDGRMKTEGGSRTVIQETSPDAR
jgi:lipopolysaccharide export system protein LptA